ncbi:MAG TPA: FGGY family carbohydrate kinase, partial [Propionibacteriaceae bacterium]|nr:FGGY family carbohydrate kinase [Propionibacteriaceae bacterium]
VDVGTTAVKVSVYDAALRTVGSALATSPTTWGSTTADVDLDVLWRTVGETVREAVAGSRPGVLVFTSQMGALALLDGHGRPAGPALTGLDRRHDPEGGRDPRTLARLRYVAAHAPRLLEDSSLLGGIKEVVVHWATGEWVTDPSSATVTGLYDWTSGQWEVPHDLSLPRLPDLVEPAAPVGTLLPEAADRLGLPATTRVLCGLGDGPASSLSAGAVGPDRACITMGTTFVSRVLAPATVTMVSAPEPPRFLQHVSGQWFCTGMRLDSFDRHDLRGTALADVLSSGEVQELRVTGGLSSSSMMRQELADLSGLPVSSTGHGDGTAGVALLALSPNDWLAEARGQCVIETVFPRVGTAR